MPIWLLIGRMFLLEEEGIKEERLISFTEGCGDSFPWNSTKLNDIMEAKNETDVAVQEKPFFYVPEG